MVARPRHYAILIGINAYNPELSPPLRGCVHDVDEIFNKLTQTVPGVHIDRLTASLGPGGYSFEPAEPKEQWPTYDNISSCLDRVIQKAEKNDHVYIHYSGHGTLEPASGGSLDSERETLALVVLEGPTASDIRYLHSRELIEKMGQMVDKGLGVTVSLDCCFSGSTLRNDEAIRYIPYRPEIAQKYPSKSKQAPKEGAESNETPVHSSRQASFLENWLLNPKDYAILASGDATELAYEVKFGGSKEGPRHGALSFFLLDAFDTMGGVGGNMRELYDTIAVKVQDYRRRKAKTQSPILIGNEKQLFFGCRSIGYSGDIPVVKVVDGDEPVLRLHAGKAHGVSENDRFTLYPIACKTSTEVVAEIAKLRGVTSDLRLIKGDAVSVQTGWLATAMTRSSLLQFPVRLKVPEDKMKDWKVAMQQKTSLEEHKKGGASSSFTIVQQNDDKYEIRDENDQFISHLAVVKDPEIARQQILNQIQHLASFRLVRCLFNPAADEDAVQFRSLFTVEMIKNTRKQITAFKPGCLQTGDIYGTCFHPNCVIKAATTDKFSLRVNNRATENNPKLHLYVYSMGSHWEIENALGTTREVFLQPGGGEQQEATGTWKQRLGFCLEDGQDECEDVLKVFLTAQPTSFSTLALPRLGGSAGREEPVLGGQRGDQKPEDWAVLTFRVRTIR